MLRVRNMRWKWGLQSVTQRWEDLAAEWIHSSRSVHWPWSILFCKPLQMRWKASCGVYDPLTHFPPNLVVLFCSVTGSSCFTWCEWNLYHVTTRAAAAAYLLCYSTLYNWVCWWGGLALSSASVKICHLSQLKDVLIASWSVICMAGAVAWILT